jgi:hypothetical protein
VLKYYFVFLNLLILEQTQAQYFSRHYSLYAGTNGYISSIQIVDDTIYAMCYVGDSIHPAYGIGAFERFDKFGNRISYNPVTLPPLINILANNNTLVHTNDGGFAYASSAGIDSDTYAIIIMKYDHYGNFQWYKEIIDSNSLAYQCSVLVQDYSSNYYLTGIIQNTTSNNTDMFLTKTDSLGNLIYTKTFLHPNFSDFGWSICFNNKGHLVLGGDALTYNINDLSTARDYMEIYELDTSGNQINYVLGTDTNGPSASNISPTDDGGYVISGSYFCYRSQNEDKWLGAIAKLDSSFNEVWKWEAGPCSQNTGFNAQKQSPDGNYIAIGTWNNDTTDHIDGWIMKYTADGQVLWSKLYQGVTSIEGYGDDNVLQSVAFMSDGSIVCAGEATNNDGTIQPAQQGWLLHLDTAGCLPDSNSCGIVDGIVNIQQAMGSARIYPNPANDQIQFEVVSDYSSGYKLLITDILGRVVSEFNQLKNDTTGIDVRQWAAGLYLYRASSGNGYEWSGKFIVEH